MKLVTGGTTNERPLRLKANKKGMNRYLEALGKRKGKTMESPVFGEPSSWQPASSCTNPPVSAPLPRPVCTQDVVGDSLCARAHKLPLRLAVTKQATLYFKHSKLHNNTVTDVSVICPITLSVRITLWPRCN